MTRDGTTEYQGGWQDGVRHGEGTHHASGQWKYQGGWRADVRCGRGSCVYADGSAYSGAWADDMPEGQGELKSSDGSVYTGAFKAGTWSGQGTMRYANGDAYVGGWLDGKRHGAGRLVCPDGSGYEGEWVADERSGQGSGRLPCGDVYSGSWLRNQRHGQGVCSFADGRRFRGAWEDGMWVQSSAEPKLCRLRGPGLARAVAGQPASFTLTARDEERNPRLSGGDEFHVILVPGRPAALNGGGGGGGGAEGAEGDSTLALSALYAVPGAVRGVLADKGDGTYEASYRCDVAGEHTLHVLSCDGGEAVAESPYPVRVLPGPPASRRCQVVWGGEGRRSAPAGTPLSLSVVAVDAFGNAWRAGKLAEALPLRVAVTGGPGGGLEGEEGNTEVEAADGGKGAFQLQLTVRKPGMYRLELWSGKVALGDSPYALRIEEGVAAAAAAAEAGGAQVDDLARRWAGIAASAFKEVDGADEGFESEEEVRETAEDRYEREHPDVPVVRNLEDMWMVQKLQAIKKKREAQAAWDAERARLRKEAAEKEAAPAEAAPAEAETAVGAEEAPVE